MAMLSMFLLLFLAAAASGQVSPFPEMNSPAVRDSSLDTSSSSDDDESSASSDSDNADKVLQDLESIMELAEARLPKNSEPEDTTAFPKPKNQDNDNEDLNAFGSFLGDVIKKSETSGSPSSNDSESDDDDDSYKRLLSSPAFSPPNFAQRNGALNPDFSNSPSTPEETYLPSQQQLNSQEATRDNPPLLQLTQGGYQRPFQPPYRRFMRPEMRSTADKMAIQPEESRNSADDLRRPQNPPQYSFGTSYQMPFTFGSGQSFVAPVGYMPFGSDSLPGQSSFLAMSPSYQDFSQTPFQSPYGQADPRTLTMYQSPARGGLADSPFSYQSSQRYEFPPSALTYPTFSPASLQTYPGFQNVQNRPRTDYSELLRNTPAENNPFNPNFYSMVSNDNRNIFSSPSPMYLPNYESPNTFSSIPQQYPVYPSRDNPMPQQPIDQQPIQDQETLKPEEEATQEKSEQLNIEADRENPSTVPFGTRLQKLADGSVPNDLQAKSDVYLRYPVSEAGYATEESLPGDNATEEGLNKAESKIQNPTLPFFSRPQPFQMYNGPDPYQNALNAVWQGLKTENNNDSSDVPKLDTQSPRRFYSPYPEQRQTLSSPSFFLPSLDVRNNFNPFQIYPGNTYPISNPVSSEDSSKVPSCAKDTNATICFEDPDYPRRELMYALNSDTFLLNRMSMPDQQLDSVTLVEQNSTDNEDSNYICKSEIKKGQPLRALNVNGSWKVIVNAGRAIGGGRFIQPVRLETCSNVGEPCNFTQVKTSCVQKYSLHRLLSWSQEKGVHNDVYRLPVACSCQIVEA